MPKPSMPIISFAWTMPAVEARLKFCTRRDWNDDYARRFKAGQLLAGYNKSARYGGQQIAIIRLTMAPYKEPYCQVPDSDWEAEGFVYLESIGARVAGMTPRELWETWKAAPPDITCYVIRFEYAGG